MKKNALVTHLFQQCFHEDQPGVPLHGSLTAPVKLWMSFLKNPEANSQCLLPEPRFFIFMFIFMNIFMFILHRNATTCFF